MPTSEKYKPLDNRFNPRAPKTDLKGCLIGFVAFVLFVLISLVAIHFYYEMYPS